MKKYMSILLLLAVLSVSFSSCGKDQKTNGDASDISIVSEESSQENGADESLDDSAAESGEESNLDIISYDGADESDTSEEGTSFTEESKTETSENGTSKSEQSLTESGKTEESSVPEESEETDDRKLSEMTAAELLNYAYIENASLDNFTAATSNEMKFAYAGQTGSYKYVSTTKADGLKGQNPKFYCKSTTSIDESEVKLTELYTNGYLYRDNGTDKYKTAVNNTQIRGILNESIGAACKLSGNAFKTIIKSETEKGGWLVTGTGLTSGSMKDILDDLLSSFDLGATSSEIKLDTFSVDTYINSDGCITLQKVNLVFTMDYSGVTLKFNTQMKTEYSSFGSTKVDVTVNPADYKDAK